MRSRAASLVRRLLLLPCESTDNLSPFCHDRLQGSGQLDGMGALQRAHVRPSSSFACREMSTPR